MGDRLGCTPLPSLAAPFSNFSLCGCQVKKKVDGTRCSRWVQVYEGRSSSGEQNGMRKTTRVRKWRPHRNENTED